ncbi:MAG TPA: uroporphyrinogen-III synthase [Candidatus Acidoferrum sp.]|nr:uroporphyrinogen-III synthase [Candidatus Acidoferrum sp.]
MPQTSFNDLRVLALESRHAKEISKLIASYGGVPTVAPAVREVSVDSREALEFAEALINGKFDMVIFLTGAGTRALVSAAEAKFARDQLTEALERVVVVARGAKPVSALREFGIRPSVIAPEPNTWREVLRALDDEIATTHPIKGLQIAIQEYGVPAPELLAGLRERGANVTTVPVYQWSLPEDVEPLRDAAKSIADGVLDVVLLTSAIQITHLFQIASELKLEEAVRHGLERMVIASIGPSTSERIRSLGLQPDMEASHPRMGFLVKEAAERSAELLQQKHKNPALSILHEIGSRMAAASPLRDVLERIIDFAASVAKFDSCFIFVLEDDELVLRASKNPHPDEIGHVSLRLGEGITGWVAEHHQPVAIARNAFQDQRFQFFNELPEDKYESFLSVPLLSRGRPVGVINLQNREPHTYSKQEIRLISTIGFLVGAEIEMARLEEKSSQLTEELETRKVVERAKGILQRDSAITEEEAYLTLRRQSRQQRKTMKEVAESILSEESARVPKKRTAS